MKTIHRIFALSVVLLLSSCGNEDLSKGIEGNSRFRIVVIDGCEYIEYDAGVADNRVYSLTHKGNCTNPAHRN